MLRRFSLLCVLIGVALGVAPALAQSADAGPVVVADVRGPLDQRALDFLEDVVRGEGAQLVVLKIDNPGIASGDPEGLFAAIENSPVPVVSWVGPDGATAYGGAAELLRLSDVAGAAPGARVGYWSPTVAGQQLNLIGGEEAWGLRDTDVVIDDEGTLEQVTVVQPTIGQFIAALDGMDVETSTGKVRLETAAEITLEDGSTAIASSVEVRFLKPTLLTRFLRLGTRPDATFFFLTAGLAAAAFEFYAAGAGVAAAVAVLALFLAGYGFSTLPMNWYAVVGAVLGQGLYTWDFQRHELGVRSIVGTILMLWAGFNFTNASPQFGPSWWAVIMTVVGIMLFYLFAMTTIVRSRFGTPTIGREHLLGARGVADSRLEPNGLVTIDGAKWRARAHRAAGIEPGTEIEVLAVEGITLQVVPSED